jgi:ABC-type glycerol-3-phosphate transport system permease component
MFGLFGVLFLHGVMGNHFHNNDFNFVWSPFGRMWMDSLLPIAFFSLVVGVCCTVLTGYALMTRQPWGRILAIVFSIFALFHFPLGTALGIYTLWVLAPRFSGDEYAALAYTQHGA